MCEAVMGQVLGFGVTYCARYVGLGFRVRL